MILITDVLNITVDNEKDFFVPESNLPVNNISRNDCDEFLEKLNKLTGVKFDLSTQEEWAARGANLSKGYEFSGNNDVLEVAWTKEDGSQT